MTDTPGWTRPGGPAGPAQPPHGPSQPPHQPPPPPGAPGPWGNVPGYPALPAEIRPGIVPLRPLGLGEIYDGAFQAVRSNPAAMVGAAAVVVTAMTVVQLVLQAWMFGSLTSLVQAAESAGPDGVPDSGAVADAIGSTSVAALVGEAVSALALSVLTAIVIVVVGNAVLGRRTSGGELWERVRRRLLPLIGVTVLTGLITAGAVLLCLLPGVLLLLFGPTVGGVVLLLFGVAAAIAVYAWLDTRLVMSGPALVLEEQRVLKAIGRAWRLTSRGFWRVLGIRLLTLVIVFVTTAIVTAPFQVVGSVFFGPPASADPLAALAPSLPQLVLTGVGSAVAATIVYPFAAAVTALLYVDQRMRLEGLDVELARAAAEPA